VAGENRTPSDRALDGTEGGAARPTGWKRWTPVAARLLVPALVVFWLVRYADLRDLGQALARISPLAFAPALACSLLIMVIGGLRWRVMMGAFGAREVPSRAQLVRLFFVGLFYNTFIPGAVGGDVVRGVITRRCFDQSVGSYVVVLLERLIGMTGMVVPVAIGLLVGPEVFTTGELLSGLAVAGIAALALTVFVLASGRLSSHLTQLPSVRRPSLLGVAFVLSLVSHFCGITVVYSLARGMDLPVSYAGLVLVVPIALTAGFLPLAVMGIGAREVTLVAMVHLLGVDPEHGVALSLAYAGVNLVVAGIGGVLQLLGRRAGDAAALSPPTA